MPGGKLQKHNHASVMELNGSPPEVALWPGSERSPLRTRDPSLHPPRGSVPPQGPTNRPRIVRKFFPSVARPQATRAEPARQEDSEDEEEEEEEESESGSSGEEEEKDKKVGRAHGVAQRYLCRMPKLRVVHCRPSTQSAELVPEKGRSRPGFGPASIRPRP